MRAHVTYDGTTLSLTITDTAGGVSFANSWVVNIPTTVNSSTAYVGFTGGTGGVTAVQDVITWTYSSGTPKTAVRYSATSLPLRLTRELISAISISQRLAIVRSNSRSLGKPAGSTGYTLAFDEIILTPQ